MSPARVGLSDFHPIWVSFGVTVAGATAGQDRTNCPTRIRASYISGLDEFCGQEDFEKARISIDWMNACLQNFTKDYNLGFCSRNKSYLCGIEPRSCLSKR